MIRNGWIWTIYLFRYMLRHILVTGLILVLIIYFIDVVELLRRSSNNEKLSFLTAITMSMFKTPASIPTILPMIVIIGASIGFYRLGRRNEILIAQANGLSVLRILLGPMLAVGVLSGALLTVIDPIVAATNNQYTSIEEQVFGVRRSKLTVSTEGIWLRDRTPFRHLIISGKRIERPELDILDIIDGEVYTFDSDNKWRAHYLPEVLKFKDNQWHIQGGRVLHNDGNVSPVYSLTLSSSLTHTDLTNSHKKPETIALWEVWHYINVLDNAGLSSLGHRAYFYYQASTFLVLMGMLLIAAHFWLRRHEEKSIKQRAITALILLVGFYFFKSVMYTYGASGQLLPIVAGIAPGVILSTLGLASLLRVDQHT